MTNEFLEIFKNVSASNKANEDVNSSSREIEHSDDGINLSSREIGQPDEFSSDSLYGSYELINGEWFYRVTGYVSDMRTVTELNLSGLKRVIFDGIDFCADENVFLNWNCQGDVDLLNCYDTKYRDEPVIIEFYNCTGRIGILPLYAPIININSDKRKELTVFYCNDEGFVLDFLNVTGRANVLIYGRDKILNLHALKVSDEANLKFDTKVNITLLMKTNRVTFFSSYVLIRNVIEDSGKLYNEFENNIYPVKALCTLCKNDINNLVFTKFFKQIKDHSFKYQSHLKGIEGVRAGTMDLKDVISDFVVTYQLSYIFTKGINHNCKDSGFLF